MGIVNIVNTSTSSGGGGGEIIRELVNSSDGQGLYFSNTGYIHLANNAAVEFGTSDFSIEFVMNQTGEAGTSGGSIYQSATTVNNKFSIENHVSSNVVKLIFFNAVGAASQYDLSYNMAADYNEPTHYVVSCDRSGNAVLYRNGTEVASVSIAASASTNLGDGVTSTAMIGNSGSGYTFLGGLYRFRTWNKALSHDEVDTCFQRADVPFESQYGSETNLVSGYNFTSGYAAYGSGAIVDANTYTTGGAGSGIQKSLLTVGKKYRITVAGASSSGDFQLQAYGTWTVLATGFGTHEFTATTTAIALTATASSTVDITTFSLTAIGVLTDHDLAFANPTQSAMCQDRAGNSDGTMGGTIQQTQKIVQLNATSISVSNATARTPADGEIVADEFSIAEFKTSTNVLETNVAGQTGARLRAAVSDVGTPTFSFNDDTDTGMYRAAANSLGFTTAGVARMSISSAGDVSVNATTPKAKLHVKATGTNWEDSLLLEKNSGNTGWNFLPGNSGNNDLWIGYNADTSASLTSQSATTALAISSAGETKITRSGDEPCLELATDNAGCKLLFARSGDPTAYIRMYEDGATGTGSLRLATGTSATPVERLQITSSGAVQVLSDGASNNPAHLSLWAKDTSIAGGDVIGTILGQGSDNATSPPLTGAKINFVSDHAWDGQASNYQSTRIEFATQDNSGSNTLTSPRMTISSTGAVSVNNGNMTVKKSTGVGNTTLKVENDNSGNAAVLELEGKRTSDNDSCQIQFSNSGEIISAIKAFRSGANDAGKLELFTSASGSSGLTTRMQISSGGLCTFTSGIAFSQTNTSATGATATSATLDHYEEGTCTLLVAGNTSGVKTAGSSNVAKYNRIGNLVTVTGTVAVNGSESIAGEVKLTGLPFTSSSTANFRGAGFVGANSGAVSNTSGFTQIRFVVDPNSAYAWIVQVAADNTSYSHTPAVSSAANVALLGIVITYQV